MGCLSQILNTAAAIVDETGPVPVIGERADAINGPVANVSLVFCLARMGLKAATVRLAHS